MKTDYKNDILADSMNDLRRYEMINNGDETVSFRDVSEYTQKGDRVTAGVMNSIGTHIEDIEDFLRRGYYVGEVSVPIPLASAGKTFKTTVEIPSVPSGASGKVFVPVFSAVKGTGSNNIYNYYQEIRTVRDGEQHIVGYTLYSEWKNPSSTLVEKATAKINILYLREF